MGGHDDRLRLQKGVIVNQERKVSVLDAITGLETERELTAEDIAAFPQPEPDSE